MRQFALPIILSLFALLGASTIVPAFADSVIGSPILVGSGPIAITVNPTANTIYVANQNNGTVSVINGATNAVTGPISVGSGPDAISVNPTTNTIYVANYNDGTVSVINGATNAVTGPILVGSGPAAIAVNPTTNTIYVANQNDGTVSVINGATNAVTGPILVGSGPDAISVNPTTNTIYVANYNDGTVSVINGATNAVTGPISVGSGPAAISVNPTANTIYVVNQNDGTVSVIGSSSPIQTPLEQTKSVVASLSALTSVNKDDKNDLKDAIADLTKSTANALWQTNGTNLNTKNGDQVFDDHKDVVGDLGDIIKHNKESQSFNTSAQDVITTIVGVDQSIAKIAINQANGVTGGDSAKDLAQAQKEFNVAASLTQSNQAVDHYKNAWEHAEDALKDATEKAHHHPLPPPHGHH